MMDDDDIEQASPRDEVEQESPRKKKKKEFTGEVEQPSPKNKHKHSLQFQFMLADTTEERFRLLRLMRIEEEQMISDYLNQYSPTVRVNQRISELSCWSCRKKLKRHHVKYEFTRLVKGILKKRTYCEDCVEDIDPKLELTFRRRY